MPTPWLEIEITYDSIIKETLFLTELNEILGKGNQQKTVFENSKDFSGL